MRRMLVGALVVGLVGCATATAPTLVGDDDVEDPDATAIDAPRIDANLPIDGPDIQTITLSQTGSNIVMSGSSVACTNTGTGVTRENSYYRAFRLGDFGITRPFTPTMVSFGVELAGGGSGQQTQNVQVKLHLLNGPMAVANLTNVAGNNVLVPNSMISMINVPIAPAPIVQSNQTLVAEVFVPDGELVGNAFYIGGNNGTETQPGYLRAPACGILEPVTYASINFPQIRVVLTVTGTH